VVQFYILKPCTEQKRTSFISNVYIVDILHTLTIHHITKVIKAENKRKQVVISQCGELK